jgi:hypothetical protein
LEVRSHSRTISTAVVVLPLPGGPWIKVIRFSAAFSTANYYSGFNCVLVEVAMVKQRTNESKVINLYLLYIYLSIDLSI